MVSPLRYNEMVNLEIDRKFVRHYAVKFDGNNYSNGVYFYQLIANGNVITKKFVLMKQINLSSLGCSTIAEVQALRKNSL